MSSLFPTKISFPLTDLHQVDVTSLVVLRHEYRMDVARISIDVSYDEINKSVWAGSPLFVRWGSPLRFDEFIGYVHSFRPQTEEMTKRTEIIAISAAYPMINESGKTYTNVGIHNVAQEIGDDYRLQVETEPHPYVHDQILQRGDSDWELLARLGQQWGYILLVDGVTLVFRPLKDVLEENYRYSFHARTNSMGALDPLANILSFEESYSATGRDPLTGTGLYGVDPVDVQIINRRDVVPIEGVFEEIDANRSVTSNLEGELKISGITIDRQFPYEARATFRAAFRKKPFDVYRILNDGKYKTWVVRSVRHVVTGGDYLSEMILGSDGMDHSAKSKDSQLDINTLLKQNRRAKRPKPMIVNNRPYLVGAGASVVVPDQRWKAQVMTIPADDREDWRDKSPQTTGILPSDVLINASRWSAAGFGYDNTQPAPIPVEDGMSFTWTTNAGSVALQGVFFDAVEGQSYVLSMTVRSTDRAASWRASIGWTASTSWTHPDGTEQTRTLSWIAPQTRAYLWGIETLGPNSSTHVVTDIKVRQQRPSRAAVLSRKVIS